MIANKIIIYILGYVMKFFKTIVTFNLTLNVNNVLKIIFLNLIKTITNNVNFVANQDIKD